MSDQGPVAAETPNTTTELPVGAETPPGTEEMTVLVSQKAQQLTNEELEGMVGELDREAQQEAAVGRLVVDAPLPHIARDGWLKIDEAGTPEGSVTKIPPDDGNTAAFPVRYDEPVLPHILVTPSGAYINDANMQPSPQLGKYSSTSYRRDYAEIARIKAEADPVSWVSSNSIGQAA